MDNPIIELRAVLVRHLGMESVPYDRRKELPRVDFYGLYENLPDGTQEHLSDLHVDFEIEPVSKAMKKDADVSFLRGIVYALRMTEEGESTVSVLQSVGIQKDELPFLEPNDVVPIANRILSAYPEFLNHLPKHD